MRRRGQGHSPTLRVDREHDHSTRPRHVEALHLEVFPHNEAAIALYERSGFLRTAYRTRAYPRRSGDCWDAIAMELRLAAAAPGLVKYQR